MAWGAAKDKRSEGLVDGREAVHHSRSIRDLQPHDASWAPIARNRAVQMGDHAIIVHNPLIPKAAGPVKADGSPEHVLRVEHSGAGYAQASDADASHVGSRRGRHPTAELG